MPENPDNKRIEKLLKAYADQRRREAGVPLEMPPATRRRLNQAIDRHHPSRSGRNRHWLDLWRLVWPRVGFAVGLFVVLAVLVWGLNQERSPEAQMAMNDTSPESRAPVRLEDESVERENRSAETRRGLSPSQPAPAPLAQSSDASSSTISTREADKFQTLADYEMKRPLPAAPVSAPAPAPVSSIAGPAKEELESLAKGKLIAQDRSLDQIAPAMEISPLQTAAPAPSREVSANQETFRRLAPARSMTTQEGSLSRGGVAAATGAAGEMVGGVLTVGGVYQTVALAETAPPKVSPNAAEQVDLQVLSGAALAEKKGDAVPSALVSQVLQNFSLEQAGSQIRIVESDGSIYEGNAASLPGSNLVIRVQGTNRSLQTLVNFTGTLALGISPLPVQNTSLTVAAAPAVNQGVTEPAAAVQPASASLGFAPSQTNVVTLSQDNLSLVRQQTSGLPSQVILRGRAQFGLTNEVEIQAVRLRP